MVKIVSSILKNNNYSPGRLYRPCINALLRLKSTSKKDEIASRRDNQRLIDYTFGPPTLYEPDVAKVANTKPQNKATLMDSIKQRLGKYAKSRGVLNPNFMHKPEHKYKGIEEVTKKMKVVNQELVISHNEEIKQAPKKKLPKGFLRKKAQKSKLENTVKFTTPDISHLTSPRYYRKTESQMFDDLATKYMKEELDQIDNQLARDMEHLEFPSFRPNGGAVVPSTLVNMSDNADSTQFSNYSHYFEPSLNYMDILASKEANVLEIYSDRNELQHENLPLLLVNCLNQFDATPSKGDIGSPIAKLELDESLPLHIMMPIVASNDANIYQIDSFYNLDQHHHEIVPLHLIDCLNQFESTQEISDNNYHITKLELEETVPRYTLNLELCVKEDNVVGATSVSQVVTEPIQQIKELNTVVQTKPKENHEELKSVNIENSAEENFDRTNASRAMENEKQIQRDDNVNTQSWNDITPNYYFRNFNQTVLNQNCTDRKEIESPTQDTQKTHNIQAQTSPKSDVERPKALPSAVLTQAQSNQEQPQALPSAVLTQAQSSNEQPKVLPSAVPAQAQCNASNLTESLQPLNESTHYFRGREGKVGKQLLPELKPNLSTYYPEKNNETQTTATDQTIQKESRATQYIQAQPLPKSKEKQLKALLEAVRMETKANALKVSHAEKSADIDLHQHNDEVLTKVNDMKDLELNPNLPLEELLRRIRARNRLQSYKKLRPINISSLIPARKPEHSEICPSPDLKNPNSPECPPPSLSAKGCPPTDRPQCPPPPGSSKVCPPEKPKCPPPGLGGRPQSPPPPSKTLKFTALNSSPKKLEFQPPLCPCPPPLNLPPPPVWPLPCQPPAPCLPQPCITPPSPALTCQPPRCLSPSCPPPCDPQPPCPQPPFPQPPCSPPRCPTPCCPPRCKFHTATHTFWHQSTLSRAVYLMDDCPTPCGPPSRSKVTPPKCPPDPIKCPPERPKKCPEVDPCPKPAKCPPDPPTCPPDPCPPKPKCPTKPKCPPPPKRKCAPEPKCPPIRKCPPEPKCAPKPLCPPKPKCPPEPKCPPKPKCIAGCFLHDSVIVVSSLDHVLSTPTLACNLSNSSKEIIENGLLPLKTTSCMVITESIMEMRTLYLNRVKDFEPWTPIPSWPHPIKEKKQKLQCPRDGCPNHRPSRPPCPNHPCRGFPKRLSFSEI